MIELLVFFLSTTNALPGHVAYSLLEQRGNPALNDDRVAAYVKTDFVHHRNYADIAAILDWDQTNALSKQAHTDPLQLRQRVAPTLSVPPSPNNSRLQKLYAQAWVAQWPATETEEQLLRLLAIQNPVIADDFFEKLSQNPRNNNLTDWYRWYQLTKQKEFSRADKLKQTARLKTDIAVTRAFPSQFPQLSVDNPQPYRIERYTYQPPIKTWSVDLTDPVPKLRFTLSTWTKPAHTYNKTFQYGPSWQLTYCYGKGQLQRTLTYTENNSYITGTIQNNTFNETNSEVPGAPNQTRQYQYHTELHYYSLNAPDPVRTTTNH